MSETVCRATITDRRYRCELPVGHEGRHSGSGWVWWHGNCEACPRVECGPSCPARTAYETTPPTAHRDRAGGANGGGDE